MNDHNNRQMVLQQPRNHCQFLSTPTYKRFDNVSGIIPHHIITKPSRMVPQPLVGLATKAKIGVIWNGK